MTGCILCSNTAVHVCAVCPHARSPAVVGAWHPFKWRRWALDLHAQPCRHGGAGAGVWNITQPTLLVTVAYVCVHVCKVEDGVGEAINSTLRPTDPFVTTPQDLSVLLIVHLLFAPVDSY